MLFLGKFKGIGREDELKSNWQHLENLSFISSEELVGFKILSVSLGKTSNISTPKNLGVLGFFAHISFFFKNAEVMTKTWYCCLVSAQ